MKSILSRAMLAFAFALLAIGASAQSMEPVGPGAWKLNVEKSKYSPGPPPKSSTIVIEAAGNALKFKQTTVNAEGKTVLTEYTAAYDGKDVPYTGSPNIDTVSLRKIDAHTTERTDKKDGKVMQTVRREVAKDGKSFTATVKGTNAKGEPVNHILYWEKM